MQALVLADIPPSPPNKGGCAASAEGGGLSLLALALVVLAGRALGRRRRA